MKRQLTFLMWNIESFTNQPRPNQRGISDRRVGILQKFINRGGIDVVVLLETGSDAQKIINKINTSDPSSLFPKKASITWHGLISPVTGKDDTTYGGETYTILYKDEDLDLKLNLIGKGVQGQNYRQACMLWLGDDPILTILHAPSPAAPLADRLNVIYESALIAQLEYKKHLDAGILCGDLNIKKDEFTKLCDRIPVGYKFCGPGSVSDPTPTSVRQINNSLNTGEESQPYDQVWLYDAQGKIEISNLKLHAPQITLEDGAKLIKGKIKKLADAMELLNDPRTKKTKRPTPNSPSQQKISQCQKDLDSIQEVLDNVEKVIPDKTDAYGDKDLNKSMRSLVDSIGQWLIMAPTTLAGISSDRVLHDFHRDISSVLEQITLISNAYAGVVTIGSNVSGALLRLNMSDHKGILFTVKYTPS